VNALSFLAPLTVAIVVCEIVFPGRDLYHYGWFNVALAALAVAAMLSARAPFRAAVGARARAGVIAIAFGAAIAGFAGVASGLLAPDGRTIVGAPGASVRVDDLGGTLSFPFAVAGKNGAMPDVLLTRSGRDTAIGASARNIGTYIVSQVPRDVLYVEAADARGARLTVTQPNGSTFLSPVLLMQQRQKIPETNLDLPFDAFAVPAAHRNVKAVLFTAAQAAMLHPMSGVQAQAVLFAVDDEDDRPLPNAIGLARDGETVELGGLRLRAGLFTYPAIEYVAVPSLIAVVIGALAIAGGFLLKSVRDKGAPEVTA
jgi:hypothetical protein